MEYVQCFDIDQQLFDVMRVSLELAGPLHPATPLLCDAIVLEGWSEESICSLQIGSAD